MTEQTGAERIAAERQRQIDVEGWTAEHDDQYHYGELSLAAAAYASVASAQERGASVEDFPAHMMSSEGLWPFPDDWWKPSPDPARNMEKSGALTAAAIDRLERAKEQIND